MIYLCIAVVAGIVELASAHFMFAYLRRRDELTHQERRELYQRIQAPATAVAQHVAETMPVDEMPVAVHPDDDVDYWEAHGVPTLEES